MNDFQSLIFFYIPFAHSTENALVNFSFESNIVKPLRQKYAVTQRFISS